jgi:hypothetical protein
MQDHSTIEGPFSTLCSFKCAGDFGRAQKGATVKTTKSISTISRDESLQNS